METAKASHWSSMMVIQEANALVNFIVQGDSEEERKPSDSQWTEEEQAVIAAQGPAEPLEFNRIPAIDVQVQSDLAAQEAVYQAEKAFDTQLKPVRLKEGDPGFELGCDSFAMVKASA